MKDLQIEDWSKLSDTVTSMRKLRAEDTKSKCIVKTSLGPATVYHMGKDNPIIRIDLSIKEE